jgi:guanylate kinase
MKGKLFILSGQSGVGKNTILEAIWKAHPDFHRAVTYTTRDPRPNEIPGEDHYFVYQEKFAEMIKKGEFLEYAQVHGEMYGTPKEQVKKALASGKNVLMEIDVRGATQVKKIMPEAILIFIKYESSDIETAIRNRLKNDLSRGDISEEEIQTRITTAKKEAEYEQYYDYSVVNPEGHPEQAIEAVEKIIQNELKKLS